MKISVVIPPTEEAVASNLYGMTDQRARPQLLPSDEELEELEKKEREGQKSTKAKETKKPKPESKEGEDADAEEDADTDEEDDGMGDLDDDEDDDAGESEEDEEESEEGDEESEEGDEESEEGDDEESAEGDDEDEDDEGEVAAASSYMIDRRPITNSKLGVVISGFPGVGKSEFSRLATQNGISVSDSDSSKFNKIDFPSNYIEHIQRMRRERNIVLVSSHKSVRDAMDEVGIEYTLVIPEASLKSLYMENYKQRGSDVNFLSFMKSEWDNLLDTCIPTEGSTVVELPEGKYLSDIISDLV